MAVGFINQSANATPFDNTTNNFVSTDVQDAIVEARSFISSPTIDQTVYVSKNGNDTTGNGSFGLPFLTIGQALTSITDSSSTKRYVIIVDAGDYVENLVLKANIFIRGSNPIATRITGSTINITDASWNNGSDNRSGFQDITLNNVATWDFTSEASDTSGKLYFFNIRTGSAWTVTTDNAIQQLIIQDSEFFGTTTFNGCTTYVSGTTWQSGNIIVNSVSTAGVPANFTAVGCYILGNISATWTSNSAVTLNLTTITLSSASTLTASGASCVVNANQGSLPIAANRTFSSNAVLNRIGDYIATGLLSATTNVDTSLASAPSIGQILVATSSTAANWQFPGVILVNFGDASDGNVTLTSGTTTLARDMYYNSLTVTSPAILNTNGFRIFIAGTLSGTGTIQFNGTNGTTATSGTGGAGASGVSGTTSGGSGAGGSGGNAGNNTAGTVGSQAGTVNGYGAVGGAGGAGSTNTTIGGSAAGGAIGTLNYYPERVVELEHILYLSGSMALKLGGGGGSGGGGGETPLLGTTNGGGGGGGSGGGVIIIFVNTLNFTGIIQSNGGNGGNGAPGGTNNGGGGGGAGGGGGGNIYIICITNTSVGTLKVQGGTAGTGGAANGTGKAGVTGSAGSTGHTEIYSYATSTWTVT